MRLLSLWGQPAAASSKRRDALTITYVYIQTFPFTGQKALSQGKGCLIIKALRVFPSASMCTKFGTSMCTKFGTDVYKVRDRCVQSSGQKMPPFLSAVPYFIGVSRCQSLLAASRTSPAAAAAIAAAAPLMPCNGLCMSTKFGTENTAAMPLRPLCRLRLRACGLLSHFPDNLRPCRRCGSGLLSRVCVQSSGQKMPLIMPCKPCAAYLYGLLLQNCKSRTKYPAAAAAAVPPFLCGFRRILPQPSKGDALHLSPLRDAAFFPHPPPGCHALPGAFGCAAVHQIGCAAAEFSVTFGVIR